MLESISDKKKYYMLFKLAIFTGCRQGELLGLKWTDVLWTTSQIYIKRTFNKKAWYNPKTKTSIRKIDMGPSVLADLKQWQRECPKTELDLIFPNRDGGPMDQSHMLNRFFFPALKKAGIPRIRFHDLRHTFASLLIDQGENIKYIQTQLGHSTPSVTLNTYAHLLKPVNQKAASRLEKMVLGESGDQMETRSKKRLTCVNVNP
ncbi:MAG: site-specific integrase [Desulfobacteraceae bacterium]|nr:MAG: site-specific integrase [Desulfobacteraceae bacterium]